MNKLKKSHQSQNRKSVAACFGLFAFFTLLFPSYVFAQCTNCTTTNVGGDVVLTFTSGAGTFTPPEGVTSVQYLVVGGGGGGGGNIADNAAGGGGGGAGGLRTGNLAVTVQTYNVVVGAGGIRGVGNSAPGGSGGNSSFATITALGGGGGASVGNNNGVAGGSGGGGRLDSAGVGGAGSAGQGNNGGNGSSSNFAAGGGGGAGGVGVTGLTTGVGGAGGAGVSTSISGAAITYAGGGGGGGYNAVGGAGGSGGGGSAPAGRAIGGSATANTGGGGGGATGSTTGTAMNGGLGGSGIVIVRYTPGGPRYAVANGNWNATSTWSASGCFGTAGAPVPTAADDVVICDSRTVTITAAAAAKSVELQTGNNNVSLNHNAGVSLSVGSGGVTLNGNTGAASVKTWNIGAGSAVVAGAVTLNGGNNDDRISRILLTNGTLDINGNLVFNGGSPARASIEASGPANIFLAGAMTIPGGSGRISPGTSTFTYDGTGTQTLLLGVSEIDYHNLTLAGSGIKNQTSWSIPTITGVTTVNAGITFNNSASVIYGGNFINNGNTNASASHQYQGNFINNATYTASAAQEYRANFTNAGTFTSGSGLHTFNGTSQQQLTGATNFTNMALNNTAGLVINNDVTALEQLLLVNGPLITGNQIMRVAQTGGWSGISRTNGWVAGNLGLWMPPGWQGRTFEIGDASAYRPLLITIPSVTMAGYVIASISQSNGDHPQIASSALDPARSVNRWWSITSGGAAMAGMDVTFNYLAGDIDGGADPQNFSIQRLDGGSWSDVNPGSRTATSTQGMAIPAFGQFAVAERGVVAPVCDNLASGLVGQYFNNQTLSGSATATQVDGPINFDWDTGAPGVAGVGADNFSVRWEGVLRTTSTGTYQFQTVSDDGVRLWVNDVLVINNWTLHSSTVDTSGNVSLVAGQIYNIRLEVYENTGFAEMRLRWRTPGSGVFVPIPAGPLPALGAGLYHCSEASFCASGTVAGGIQGSYFNNLSLSGSPTGTRIDGPIDFDWAAGAPGVAGVAANQFSIRWEGLVRAPETGNYQFQTVSDDGIRLWVNGVQVINNWTDHAAATNTSGNVALQAGETYTIRMEFYENGGQAVIRLRWRLPSSGSYVPIPAGPTPTLGGGLYYCADVPSVAGYQLTHAPTALTCEAEAITVTALDGANNPIVPPAGTQVQMSTLPATGVWVGGATYTFSGTENFFVKYLQQTSAATLTLAATDGVASGSSSISFADTGLRFYDLPVLPASAVAGDTYSGASVRAVQTNTDTGACEARVTGSRPVRLGYECLDPGVCSGGQAFAIASGTAAANNSGAISNFNNVILNFDANGSAPIPFSFTDVGRVRLHGELLLAAEGNDPAITLPGSSADFVVKPHSFVITQARNGANAEGIDGTAGFAAAGENFRVVVQSRNAAGNLTPNYGNESIAQGMILRVDGVAYPVGGAPGAITNPQAFASTGVGGEFQNTAITWSEVGNLVLSAAVAGGSYLNAGDVPNSPGVSIGRFYPHHFHFVNSDVQDACTGFSYMSQPTMTFTYQLLARNLSNGLTANYTSPGYLETASIAYHAENNNDGNDLGARVQVVPGSWVAGVWNVNTTAASFLRQNLAPPATQLDGPFGNLQFGFSISDPFNRPLQDLDMNPQATGDCEASNSCTAKMLGTPRILRFGRLRLDDAFGPETVNLPVNFATEYWDNGFWRPFSIDSESDDSCTVIPREAISYSPTGPLSLDANRTVSLGTGVTQGNYASIDAVEVSFADGDAGHFFTPPSPGTGSFQVNVDLTTMPWLRFDWNQDGNHNNDTALPPANIGFGQYRGHDRIIYWREVLEN